MMNTYGQTMVFSILKVDAKSYKFKLKKEPEIYGIRFGALLENTMIDSKRNIDFNDGHITQNTRVSYPEYIKSAKIVRLAKKILFF